MSHSEVVERDKTGAAEESRRVASRPVASDDEVAFAYVGIVVPDRSEFHTPAFSRAAQMFQENLLVGMKRAGLCPSLVVSARPVPSFPASRQLWVGGGEVELGEGIDAKLVPFLNVTPLKQALIGLCTLWELLKWGWRTRGYRHRVICTYNLTVPPGLCTLLAARLLGAKATVSLCDIYIPGETVPNTLLNRFDFWLHRKIIPRFDGHIVVSDEIMRDFAPGKPYVRMEGGLSESVFARDSTDSLRKSADDPFITVFAGKLDPVNGIPILLDAFSQLKGDRYRLVIAGGGPQQELVKQAVIDDSRIQYVGFLSFPDVLQLYRTADLLVSIRPTKKLKTNYFFPSKTMECLASGTPVMTTCTGHIEQEFGTLCYVLKDETPEAVAQMIQHVASTPLSERRRLASRARAYMQANKTWDSQAQKVVKFIREIVLNQGAEIMRRCAN